MEYGDEQAHLEKQVKDLKVRVVDLETKSYANPSRPSTISRRRDSRIDELTNQQSKEKGESQRSPDSIPREPRTQQAELERQKRFEDERLLYESRIENLRSALDNMQTEESKLQLAKRRAEREAAEFKQKALK
jgi:myosin heavy chain 9/10/11/14